MQPRHATWGHAVRRRAGIRRRRLLAISVLILLGWASGFVWFIGALKQPGTPATPAMTRSDATRSDAIIVFTGGSLRLEAGLALLASNKAPKLFVSGVHTGVGVKQLLRLSLQHPEALDCCIDLGYAANDTRGNAVETASWLQAEGRTSLRLVTANYHMPRSLLELRHAAPFAIITRHPVSPPHVPLGHWWRKPATGLLLFGEYNKYLLAHLRILVSPVFEFSGNFEKS
jgi:uncharacterized SAM-binding protein YcdF (DUF218 family)